MYAMMIPAAVRLKELLRAVQPAQLTAPTPCTEYNVRALLNHLLYWGPWLEAAARKQPAPSSEGSAADVDLTGGDWAARLEKQIDGLAEAYARPDAVEGMTNMGGAELPASMVGWMVLGEFVVHGWDLARGTGLPFDCDPDIAEALYVEAAATAEQARQMGVYGTEVSVLASAPPLDRLLGVTGRDPAWTP